VCSGLPSWLGEETGRKRRVRERNRSKREPPRTHVPAEAVVSSRRVSPQLVAAAAPVGRDAELRERLRQWRQAVAKEHKVPAFVVLHDTSLDDLCRRKPASLDELRQVHGFGEKKTADYGAQILKVFAELRR
jgi:ATP-dependent DNA helicase RecQ